MEITKINPRGYSCTVIFTGSHYYFYSDYAGLFAIAERVNVRENIGTNKQDFTIQAGNDHLLGGSLGSASVCAEIAKRFISKSENKYIPQKVRYTVEAANLENHVLKVEAVSR